MSRRRAANALLFKDLREHNFTVAMLFVGAITLVVLLLATNSVSAYSMEALGVASVGLRYVLPLLLIVLGNVLISREMIGRTRYFVEALPVGPWVMLVHKYSLGLTIAVCIALAITATCLWWPGGATDFDSALLVSVALRSLGIATLLWSVVFTISLGGRLRLFFYMLIFGVYLILERTGGDAFANFGPVALIDSQLFAHERDTLPWFDLVVTLALAIGFSAVGFVIARLNDGALSERLAQPMTRGDFALVAVVVLGGFTAYGVWFKADTPRWELPAGERVIASKSPQLSVYYQYNEDRALGRQVHADLRKLLVNIEASHQLTRLPSVTIRFNERLEPLEIRFGGGTGVDVAMNVTGADAYHLSQLYAQVVHGILQHSTANRAVHEPYHWILDGVAQWWAQSTLTDREREAFFNEQIARALVVTGRQDEAVRLSLHFDRIVDMAGFRGAEAMAYSAIHYLETRLGKNAIHALGVEFLSRPVGTAVWQVIADRADSVSERFQQATGLTFSEFERDWQRWLEEQSAGHGVSALVDLVPDIVGEASVFVDANGYRWLQGRYIGKLTGQSTDGKRCALVQIPIAETNTFVLPEFAERDETACAVGQHVHQVSLDSRPGSRLYVAFYFDHPTLHWPIMLNSQRQTLR